MNRPFLLISIPLVLGIIITYFFNLSMPISSSLFIILFIICILNIIRKRSNNLLFMILFFTLGSIITSYYTNASVLLDFVDREIEMEAIVDEILWRDKGLSKYLVKVDKTVFNGEVRKIKEKTVLKISGDNQLDLGHRIVFRGKIREPLENTNPKLYNYRLNLLTNKIFTSINIKDYNIIDLDTSGQALKYKLRIGFRDMVEGLFDRHLDKSPSNLIKGIIMGETSYLDEDEVFKYREMGLAHILAVSGLHIGIISGFLIFIFSHLGIKKRVNIFIVLGIIWFYAFLIGFPPSVLRASIMFSFLFFAETLAEPYDSINILFLSFFILLLSNPILIFNLGFQLSYLATFSILFFSPYITRVFYPYKNKLTFALSGLLAVYAGILPIQLYYFNSFSLVGILSNLIIAPILSLALILGGIMIILNYLPIINIFIAYLLNFILKLQGYIVDIIYGKGLGIIDYHSPSIYEMVLYYIIILILLKIIDFKEWKYSIKKAIFSYTIIFLVFNFLFIAFDNSMKIDFLDVGQGDCILVKTRKGSYLIDTGGNEFSDFDIGENIVLPYLIKHGINKLDGVFITHFHLDHCKSLPLLMDKIPINNIFISYENPDSVIYRTIRESDIPVTILNEGDMIFLGKNIAIDVLSPDFDFQKRGFSENDLSLTFNLSYYNKNILFTGDIEKKAEEILSRKLKDEIFLLKSPHHGSKTSSSEDLLNILKAKVAVISVGRNNFYGHPNDEVVDRYRSMGTESYRTDTMGMVRVSLNKDRVNITPFLDNEGFLDLLDEHLSYWIFILVYCLISYILIKVYSIKEGELEKYGLQ